MGKVALLPLTVAASGRPCLCRWSPLILEQCATAAPSRSYQCHPVLFLPSPPPSLRFAHKCLRKNPLWCFLANTSNALGQQIPRRAGLEDFSRLLIVLEVLWKDSIKMRKVATRRKLRHFEIASLGDFFFFNINYFLKKPHQFLVWNNYPGFRHDQIWTDFSQTYPPPFFFMRTI